jgi:hypothetical protein
MNNNLTLIHVTDQELAVIQAIRSTTRYTAAPSLPPINTITPKRVRPFNWNKSKAVIDTSTGTHYSSLNCCSRATGIPTIEISKGIRYVPNYRFKLA